MEGQRKAPTAITPQNRNKKRRLESNYAKKNWRVRNVESRRSRFENDYIRGIRAGKGSLDWEESNRFPFFTFWPPFCSQLLSSCLPLFCSPVLTFVGGGEGDQKRHISSVKVGEFALFQNAIYQQRKNTNRAKTTSARSRAKSPFARQVRGKPRNLLLTAIEEKISKRAKIKTL